MKRTLLVLVAALALGGAVGALMVRDPGYVLLAYDQMAVETSLWVALLLLVVVYLLIRLGVGLVAQLAHGRGNLRGWASRRRSRAAAERALRGQLLLAEARWAEARKLLEASAPQLAAPLLNYLGAARAAQELGDIPGRDQLLLAAQNSTPNAELAVGLAQA
ncbi:MAG: heme biosynthesis protein HemY, partial [Pseudomonadales bacterium]